MEGVAQECIGQDLPPGLVYPPPEDKEDFQITRDELDQLKQALKKEKFRSMLNDYAEEVQDPKNRTLFQSELRELERQNGNNVHFINPVAGYVLKTSVNGDKKAFVNMCSNPMINKLSFQKAKQDNIDGTICSIPFAQSPPREDVDKAGRYCDVYDVVFHPNTLSLCKADERIRKQVETTALDAIENSFNLKLDRNNIKRPKLKYKGMKHATMIKYRIDENPPTILDLHQLNKETPPQPQEPYFSNGKANKSSNGKSPSQKQSRDEKHPKFSAESDKQNVLKTKPVTEWTEPKYSLKYRSHVDLQDFCMDNQREGRSTKPIPEEIVLTVDLPLLKDSSTLEADVLEGGWDFELKAERRAYYHLKLKLPFQVHCDQSKASFDVDKRKLTVIMKTVQKKFNLPPLFSKHDQSSRELELRDSTAMQNSDHTNTSDSSEGSDVENRNESQYIDSDNLVSSPAKIVELPTPVETNLREDVSPGPSANENQPETVPQWINGDVVVKSILKRSARSRSMSESWLDDRSPSEEDFNSLESLNEQDEVVLASSLPKEKSVRFNESIQRQLYRSNSSIAGQRKKNQRKSRNKRKARGRLNSEGSISSMDEDDLAALKSTAGAGAGGDDDSTFENNIKSDGSELKQEE